MIIGALQDRNRNPDVTEVLGYVPTAKLWIEPRGVPAIERVVDIAMPTLELRLQARGLALIGLLDLGNRSHRNIFDDEMRGD